MLSTYQLHVSGNILPQIISFPADTSHGTKS